MVKPPSPPSPQKKILATLLSPLRHTFTCKGIFIVDGDGYALALNNIQYCADVIVLLHMQMHCPSECKQHS